MAADLIVHCDSFEMPTRAGPDIVDVTDRLRAIVADAGVRSGGAQLQAVGSTASLTTIEYEPGAIADLKQAISRLAPPEAEYQHEMTWHDGNGHSHVQAALLGPSVLVAIREGRLALGTWQQVVLINHDIHDRRRRVEVTIVGHA